MTSNNEVNKLVKTLKRIYEPEYSYEEIAKTLGYSRVTIVDIERKALHKVAKALIKLGYVKEDFF